MRGLVLALALACASVGVSSVAGCASLGQYQPTTAREALAEAEITFVGVIQLATEGVQSGAISRDDAAALDAKFTTIADYLQSARTLLAAGDQAGAGDKVALAHAILRALAVELVNRAEAQRAAAPQPGGS